MKPKLSQKPKEWRNEKHNHNGVNTEQNDVFMDIVRGMAGEMKNPTREQLLHCLQPPNAHCSEPTIASSVGMKRVERASEMEQISL